MNAASNACCALAFWIVVGSGIASEHDEREQVVRLGGPDEIYELELLSFPYDAWTEKPVTSGDIMAMMKQFKQIENLPRSIGPQLTCRINYHDWPCSRREVIGKRFSTFISDVLPLPPTSDESYEYLTSEDTPYNVFVDGLLPPPIPFWLLNDREVARSEAEARAWEDLDGQEPRGDNAALGLYYQEEDYKAKPRNGELAVPPFSAEIVEKAFRNDLWFSIEDYTSFAPVERILFGMRVFSLIEKLSEDHETTCKGVCPIITRRSLKADIKLFEYCTRRVVDNLSSPPVQCTPIAFVSKGQQWLRTRAILGVAKGRGDGPMEMFRCVTSMPMTQAAQALNTLFTTKLSAETKSSSSPARINLVAVSWKDRPSVVAKNRWEILYFDFWIRKLERPIGALVTAIDYKIPVYRLSDTKPTSLDDGARPRDKIVRQFENGMRATMAAALADGRCLAEVVD